MDLNSPPRHALLEYFMVVWVLRSLIRLFFMWRNYFYQLFCGKVRIYCRNFLLGNSNGALQVEFLINFSDSLFWSNLTMDVRDLGEREGFWKGFYDNKTLQMSPYKKPLSKKVQITKFTWTLPSIVPSSHCLIETKFFQFFLSSPHWH